MKGALVAAALASGVTANVHHRHGHDLFHKRGGYEQPGQVCSTIYTWVTGEPTLVPNPPPATTMAAQGYTAPPPPLMTTVLVVPLPTPEAHTCPTPGTYTIPATTVTVSETTTVCGATSTYVPPGTHTVGGVTTIVETSTTVTCPYATVQTSGTVTTSTILTTEYVCPSAGTYTIAPITTTCTESTTLVYPTPTSYVPGTYTAPRQVITVTETDYTTWCPYTSSGSVPTSTAAPPPPPTYETPQSTYQAPKSTSEASQPTSEAPKPTYEAPKPTSEAPKSTQESAKPQPTSYGGGGGNLSGSGDHYGITYTPYQNPSGNCKSASEVEKDIAQIASEGFQIVRTYSTDCSTLESVGSACEKYGLKMIVGIFVKGGGCSYDSPDIKEQVDAMAAWAKWDIVDLVVVGNEAIMNGFCSPSDLAGLITIVKSKCPAFHGPYTISETLNIWQRSDVSSALCGVVDVTGANIHPYFNPNVTPQNAGEFVSGQLSILESICPGNNVINLECGWPTKGNPNGIAVPGVSQQKQAIDSIRKSCGHKTVFFSFEDDLWKAPGSCNCEDGWGTRTCWA